MRSQNRTRSKIEQATPGEGRPFITKLLLLFPSFFPAAFARQGFLHAPLLSRLQVEGVSLDLLDNVFLLHLALETSQCVLEGFTLLKPYFCQTYTPPNPSGWTE